MNSVETYSHISVLLQSLASLPAFVDYTLDNNDRINDHQFYIKDSDIYIQWKILLRHILNVDNIYENKRVGIKPHNFVNSFLKKYGKTNTTTNSKYMFSIFGNAKNAKIKNVSKTLTDMVYADPDKILYQMPFDDFLRKLLVSLHRSVSISGKTIILMRRDIYEKTSTRQWNHHFSTKSSPIAEMFYGQTFNIHKRCQIGIKEATDLSNNYNFKTDCIVTLPLPNISSSESKPINLYDCLDLYISMVRVNTQRKKNINKYYTTIKTNFWKMSQILILKLDRVGNNTLCQIPHLLDLSKYQSQTIMMSEKTQYELYSIIGISSTTTAGTKFYSMCRERYNNNKEFELKSDKTKEPIGKWHKYTDDKVQEISTLDVTRAVGAVYLFYQQKN
jgi:hypothetical protein